MFHSFYVSMLIVFLIMMNNYRDYSVAKRLVDLARADHMGRQHLLLGLWCIPTPEGSL